jgi:glutathione synthase/RimK-type ligase-like ATP-grasp enzyme
LGLDDAFGTSARIFNHPRAVVASRRDKVSSLLAGIDGLEVPKCIRFVPKKSQDFQKAFADTGMAYPVLVRPAASQTGRGLVRVDSPFDWVKALESHWYGVPHFMTQYVEYKNAFSHLYEKARVVVIGDQLFLRAYSTSPEWLVKGLPKDLTTSEAIDILNGFNSFSAGDGGWSALRFVANEIKSRLPLDFFGIDLGVRGDGTFVLFEANVAMNILTTSAPKGPKEFIERIIIGLEQPIKHYLEHPATWRHDASLLPSVREALNNSVSSTAR